MDGNKLGKDEAYFILKELKEDIRDMRDNWSQVLVKTTQQESAIQAVADQVTAINKMLVTGNGQPSLLSQISSIRSSVESVVSGQVSQDRDIADIKSDLARVEAVIPKQETPTEVRVERIKFGAKVVGFMTVVAAEVVAVMSLFKHGS